MHQVGNGIPNGERHLLMSGVVMSEAVILWCGDERGCDVVVSEAVTLWCGDE